jgi:hypothetical protein
LRNKDNGARVRAGGFAWGWAMLLGDSLGFGLRRGDLLVMVAGIALAALGLLAL